MKKILLLFIAFLLLSCSHDHSGSENTNIDTGVNIFLKNNDGLNLLNTPDYLSENFRVYNVVGGQAIEVNEPHLDYPRNFFVNTETSPASLTLFLNSDPHEEFPVTYIKWNENQTDTLKAAYSRGSGNEDYIICNKIWLNNNLVWDISADGTEGREITIIK